ncbi:MAG: NeuD/PglB/VioB family sugar acetyltransferase [Bacteroidota bacterium]
MEKPIIILGAGDLANAALAIFQKNGIVVYGLLAEDGALQRQEIHHVPILGSLADEQYLGLLGKDCEAFVALDSDAGRQQWIATLREQKQLSLVNAIHPSATLAESVSTGHGNLINVGASLGPGVTLGSHCIIHTHATIEPRAVIKDFAQIGAGSIIGAQAVIEDHVFMGIGATLIAGIQVGSGASIGAGSVVLEHVRPGARVLGNPAKPFEH